MGKKQLIYRKREFLNSEEFHSLAAVYGQIKAEWYTEEKFESGAPPDNEYIIFNISDCVRRIDIQFDTNNEKEWENSLRKIEKLEKFVTEFKDALYRLKGMVKTRNDDKNVLLDNLFNEYTEFFSINKINGKEVYTFDIQQYVDIITLTIAGVYEEDLHDKEFVKITRDIEDHYNIRIKTEVAY